MKFSDVTVEVRNKNLERVGQITHKYLDFSAVTRYCGVGEWTVSLPREHHLVPHLWAPGSGILVSIRGETYMSGPMTKPSFKASAEDPQGFATFAGVDDNILLYDARAWPTPSSSDVGAQTTSHDTRSGNAETVIKGYVDANIGPSAPASRRGALASKLRIQTDLGRGPLVSKRARFPRLGELLTELALYSNLGYKIVQVDDELEFQVYSVTDRSQEIRFSLKNHSLEDHEVVVSPPELTRAIVAGQGELIDRQFVLRTNSDATEAEADWGRIIEEFIDQRQTDDLEELDQAGDERLLEAGFTSYAVKAIPAEQPTREYLTDWREGDFVTVDINNQEPVSRITETAIVASSEGLSIGVALGDVSGFRVESALGSRVDDTQRRVEALERNLAAAAGASAAGRLVGEMVPWAGIAPGGNLPESMIGHWLICDGSLQLIADYPELYNMIGTTYGGDGVTTFGLPDARGRTLFGLQGGNTRFDTLGETGGGLNHNHSLSDAGVAQVSISGSGGVDGVHMRRVSTSTWSGNMRAPNTIEAPPSGTNTLGAALAGSTDSAEALPPYLVVRWIIKT